MGWRAMFQVGAEVGVHNVSFSPSFSDCVKASFWYPVTQVKLGENERSLGE